jgi:hypothetical protein
VLTGPQGLNIPWNELNPARTTDTPNFTPAPCSHFIAAAPDNPHAAPTQLRLPSIAPAPCGHACA